MNILHADGGATVSDLLMSTQADYLGRSVQVAVLAEASAVGAARLAAECAGVDTGATWVSQPPKLLPPTGADTSQARRRWKQSVRRSRGLPATIAKD